MKVSVNCNLLLISDEHFSKSDNLKMYQTLARNGIDIPEKIVSAKS